MLGAVPSDAAVAPRRAALTLSVFMTGFALGPLVVEPLSDHYGRRPLLLPGGTIWLRCPRCGTRIPPPNEKMPE